MMAAEGERIRGAEGEGLPVDHTGTYQPVERRAETTTIDMDTCI